MSDKKVNSWKSWRRSQCHAVRNKETGEVFESIRAAVRYERGGKECRKWRMKFWEMFGDKYERHYEYPS